ncbi:Multidrug resistance protein homolog 49 [Eumeta japonica]|uniref:Multidrug resistance protein homolog 49 n=1 Tax=Eumeta variegata TaxID=151549 RepID=A0A4C1X4Q4_EUMVA|nr:Multidrug resistance protein homolog 49 [Eumeta japonica]
MNTRTYFLLVEFNRWSDSTITKQNHSLPAGPSTVAEQGRFYAILFLCVAAACGAVCFLQSALLALAGARLTKRLRKLAFEAMLKQEAAWFDSPTNSPGALTGRLAAECGAVKGAGGARLGALLQGASTMLIGVALSAAYSWKMTIVSLVSVPFVMGGIYLEGWASRRSASRAGKELETAAKVAAEAVINIRTVQSLGVEEAMLSRYWRALAAGDAAGRAAGRLRGPVYGACLAAPTLGYAVSMSYGGYLIAREDLPYKDALLVSEALIYGAWMLGISLSLAPSFTAARRAAARLLGLLQRTPAIADVADDGEPWAASGDVSFDKVEFAYGRRPAVLRGLNLAAARGRRVALVGPSGSGKSTLIQLLMRFYEPVRGDILKGITDATFFQLLDGRSLRSLPLSVLRAQFGLVGQQPVLFDRSVYENIAYGDTARAGGVPLAEVQRAAQMANVHSFIAALPQGYETRLGSGGAQLSGGQKQRIAIARALLRDPRVLLLDEATSALDAASEQAVQATLEEVSAGRTTITVAHRLPTVKNADVIYVIDKDVDGYYYSVNLFATSHAICNRGEWTPFNRLRVLGVVAESGSHEELMKKKGIYWTLWKQQQHGS